MRIWKVSSLHCQSMPLYIYITGVFFLPPPPFLSMTESMSFVLAEWRLEEMERIDQLYSGPERKAALIGLVEQEAYLIASIDRHKIASSNDNMDKKVKAFLDKVSL